MRREFDGRSGVGEFAIRLEFADDLTAELHDVVSAPSATSTASATR